MSEQKSKNEITPQAAERESYKGLSLTFRLVLRLLTDRRVNFLLKLLPLGTLLYLLLPDPVPFIFDDAIIIGLGTYVFIELCPSEVVEEHRANLTKAPNRPVPEKDQVVDIKFEDK